MIESQKKGSCNKGFNAEPIAFAFCILHFAFCISNLNFPPKIRNFSDFGSGKNFGFGSKFYDRAKFLGSGGNFMIGRKFWVRVKNLCLGENFGFGRKF